MKGLPPPFQRALRREDQQYKARQDNPPRPPQTGRHHGRGGRRSHNKSKGRRTTVAERRVRARCGADYVTCRLAQKRDLTVAEVIHRCKFNVADWPLEIVALLVWRLALKLETRRVALTLADSLPYVATTWNG